MASVTTLYHLSNKEGSMNKALERISSGLRLNHAVDDAAGASIVNRMTSQIKGIEAAIRNAADAISLTQTAEGSLEEVSQILHRMRELSVQAANGVYTGQDRQAINNEITAMQNELGRIAESSRFNGVKMLNGEFQDTTFQIGFTANDTATLSIEDVRPQGLGEYVMSTSNSDVADVVIGASAATRTFTVAGNAASGTTTSTSSGFTLATNGTQGDKYTINAGPDVIVTDPAIDGTTFDSSTKLAAAFNAKRPTGAGYGITAAGVTAKVATLADHGTPAFETAMNASAVTGDKYVINIGGTDVSYTLLSGDVTALQAAADTAARVTYLAGKLDTAADTAGAGSADIGFGITASTTSFVVTANAAGDQTNATVIGPVRLDPNGVGAEADLGAAASDAAGTDTPEVLQWQAPTMPTTASGDKFSVTIDNNGSAVTVTTGVLGASANLDAVKDALNTAHNSVNGTFSVSGNDLRFTYNANQGNVTNTNDGALKYIPQAGTVSNGTAGVGQPALTAVTEVSHVAANPTATLSTRVVDENGVVTYTNTATMSLENGTFKTTSGDAKGIQIKAAGTQSSIIYVGKSLFNALTEFSDSVLKTNGDIDKKVARYNTDVVDYNKELTELETRMENVRERYIEQFTAMESAVSSFKSTGDMLDNLMESWKASLS